MKSLRWIPVFFFVACFILFGSGAVWAQGFALMSPQLEEGARMPMAQVYSEHGCGGENISPALMWQNPPAQTKSFAVTLFDPDARHGSGWWHWLIFNLDPSARGLPANSGNPDTALAPLGTVQSVTDFGTPGYSGPCPPAGDRAHRYIFTVYALDAPRLDLDASALPATVNASIRQHAIGHARLTVIFSR